MADAPCVGLAYNACFHLFLASVAKAISVFDVLLRKLAVAQIIADTTYAKTNPPGGNIPDAILLTISALSCNCL